ncbi:MAG: glutathione synthase [Myxococcota bacterium]|jgi:glutathione synthase
MKIAFIVNEFETLVPSQTTFMLIQRAAAAGHDVVVADVARMEIWADGSVGAIVRRAPSLDSDERVPLDDVDLLMMRTNPARHSGFEWAHQSALLMAQLLEERGVRVVNRPSGLWKAASKLYLARLPSTICPRALVSRDTAALRAFVGECDGAAVVKPLHGTRGRDVFALSGPEAPNIGPILESLVRKGPVIAQAWADGAEHGDTRVIVVQGRPLVVDGALCAMRRVPASGDFRSNIHAGGHAEPGVLTPEIERIVAVVGPILVRDGLLVAGLDVIGDRVIEINVLSPGGLRNAERFTKKDFTGALLEHVLADPP